MTPNSSATAYATPADLVVYCDWRRIADVTSDENQRPSKEAFLASAVVAKLLLAASGEVEAACLRGQRYSTQDLAALAGAGKELLARIVATFAEWMAVSRRDSAEQPEWLRERLAQLETGERIFAFVEVEEAGVLATVTTSANDRQDVNRVVRKAQRFFGTRGDTPGGGG